MSGLSGLTGQVDRVARAPSWGGTAVGAPLPTIGPIPSPPAELGFPHRCSLPSRKGHRSSREGQPSRACSLGLPTLALRTLQPQASRSTSERPSPSFLLSSAGEAGVTLVGYSVTQLCGQPKGGQS